MIKLSCIKARRFYITPSGTLKVHDTKEAFKNVVAYPPPRKTKEYRLKNGDMVMKDIYFNGVLGERNVYYENGMGFCRLYVDGATSLECDLDESSCEHGPCRYFRRDSIAKVDFFVNGEVKEKPKGMLLVWDTYERRVHDSKFAFVDRNHWV